MWTCFQLTWVNPTVWDYWSWWSKDILFYETRSHGTTFYIWPSVLVPITPLPLQCLSDVRDLYHSSLHSYYNSLKPLCWHPFTCSWPPIYLLKCQLLCWSFNQDVYSLTINFAVLYIFSITVIYQVNVVHTLSPSLWIAFSFHWFLVFAAKVYCKPLSLVSGHLTFFVTPLSLSVSWWSPLSTAS